MAASYDTVDNAARPSAQVRTASTTKLVRDKAPVRSSTMRTSSSISSRRN
jgi:hypothetical protein